MITDQQIESIKVMRLLPGDCVILKTDAMLSRDQQERALSVVRANIPEGVKALVLSAGVELEVLRKADAKETA